MDGLTFDLTALGERLQETLGNLHIDLAGITGGTWKMNTTEEVFERQVEVGPDAALTVRLHSARVTIQGGADSVIQVRATEFDSDELEGLDPVRVTHEGDRVDVSQPNDGAEYTSLDITVPRGCRVAVQNAEGEVRIEETGGPVEVRSSDGDVSVRGVSGLCSVTCNDGNVTVSEIVGSCSVTSTDGDLTISRLEGDLTATSTDGDLTIRDSALTGATINSTDGELVVETSLREGASYVLNASDGDVTVELPPSSSATITANTPDGKLHCDIPGETVTTGKRQRVIRLGAGGARMVINASDGDCIIRSGAGQRHPGHAHHPLPPVAPEAPVAPVAPVAESIPPHDETVAVLAGLEQGNLTVEEALARLDSLAGGANER